MNIKVLAKALRFACIPTLSVIVLLFCGFFSISKTIDFLQSNNGWAIALRIILAIGEITLIVVMYRQYLKEDIKENALNKYKRTETKQVSYHNSIREILKGKDDDYYYIFDTEDSNIKIIEREKVILT